MIAIPVTQQHIDQANAQRKQVYCPIEYALMDIDEHNPIGASALIRVGGVTYLTPTYVRTFMRCWDRNRPVAPIVIHLFNSDIVHP